MASTPGFEPGPHWWELGECSHHCPTLAPQLLSRLLTARISGNCQEKKRRKTNFLSTQQIVLPEEGENQDE